MVVSQQTIPGSGRNNAVHIIIETAIDVMSHVKDSLELWCISELAPEVLEVILHNGEKMFNLTLGPLTRNERLVLRPEYIEVSLDGVKYVKLPYDAIYCVAAPKVFADDLNWPVQGEVAFVNLVTEAHHLYPVVVN